MMVLKYRGIKFDSWELNDDGSYWAEICQACAAKYGDKVKDAIDDGGTARGCCSIKGCFNSGEDENVMHYYIDFEPEDVSFGEMGENESYDEQYI